MTKTNAMRLLEKSKISYSTVEYEVDENDLSGQHVAQQLLQPCESVFKTLVVKGQKQGYNVCCIPVNEELDMKKVAKIIKDKKVEMIPVKDLLKVTGYIRGGCSPIGMKKHFPTYFHESVLEQSEIAISAGVRGMQIMIEPSILLEFLGAKHADLIKRDE
ncbi:MAG TPA: Cys-tRNA(Pro) deacylase [Candidatus Merdenecus merdavium]|nr:Cys-tRNA(Pro) deacylase [Candidatus Merdenecus merdavium]